MSETLPREARVETGDERPGLRPALLTEKYHINGPESRFRFQPKLDSRGVQEILHRVAVHPVFQPLGDLGKIPSLFRIQIHRLGRHFLTYPQAIRLRRPLFGPVASVGEVPAELLRVPRSLLVSAPVEHLGDLLSIADHSLGDGDE